MLTSPDDQIARLREHIVELEREKAALHRWIKELRDAIDALLQPAPSELLPKNSAHPSRHQ